MVKAIYFDVGGVLVTDGFARAAPLFAKELGIDEQTLIENYAATTNWRYSAGLEGRERWVRFFQRLGREDADIDHFLQLWHSVFLPIEGSLEIVKSLQGKYLLGVLTDQPADIIPHLERLRIFDPFDIKVVSCEVKHSKKEENGEIYRIAAHKAGIGPQEILFIDNNQRNLDAASQQGFRTLLFKDPAQLQIALQALMIV